MIAITAAFLLLSSRPAQAAPASPPDACGLLSPATIKAAIGVEAQPGKAGTSYFAGNTNCQFPLAGNAVLAVIVTTGANQPNTFKPRGASDQRFTNASPLAGVGDRAYIWPATANDATVDFLKGNTEVDLRVSNVKKALSPEQLTALAKAALAKVP
jgi:hypothetical protein